MNGEILKFISEPILFPSFQEAIMVYSFNLFSLMYEDFMTGRDRRLDYTYTYLKIKSLIALAIIAHGILTLNYRVVVYYIKELYQLRLYYSKVYFNEGSAYKGVVTDIFSLAVISAMVEDIYSINWMMGLFSFLTLRIC